MHEHECDPDDDPAAPVIEESSHEKRCYRRIPMAECNAATHTATPHSWRERMWPMSSKITRTLGAITGATVLLAGLAACSTPVAEVQPHVTEGKLTIATGEPAYYPYVIDNAPESGEGFEAAVAYAVAEELGFAAEDVVWVRATWDETIAPGPKPYDINLQQVSISDERKASIDFSSAYYSAPQAVITVDGSPAAKATSVTDLAAFDIGAATGTTSLKAVEELIAPTSGAKVFNSNDDAKLALESGQVDAIVVDLPTAYYITGVELAGGVIVGQLPDVAGDTDSWGITLGKDSPLTASVTAAVDALRDSGKLRAITEQWLGTGAGVPLLK